MADEDAVRLLDASGGAAGEDGDDIGGVAEETTVDDVLETIGEFGFFQKRHYAHLSYAWVPQAIYALNFVFISPTVVPWRCKLPLLDNAVCNATETFNDADGMERLCSIVDSGEWEFTAPQNTVTAEFRLICDDQWKAPFLASLYFMGVGIGAPIFGAISDRLGRRKAYLSSMLGCALFCLVSAFCNSFGPFAVSRLFCGIFSSGWTLSGYALTGELIGSGYRACAMTLNQGFFALGEMVLAGVAFAVPGWRDQTLVSMLFFLPSFIGAATILIESPRWLLATGDANAATEVLKLVARLNGKPYPDHLALTVASTTADADADGGSQTGASGEAGATGGAQADVALGEALPMSALFRLRVLRQRQLTLMFGWFTCSLLYYGLSIAASSITGDPYQDFTVSALAEIPGVVLAKYGLDWHRSGRRGSLVASFGLASMSSLILVIMVMAGSSPGAKTVLAFAGKLGITAAFSIVYVYPIELMPTGLRVGAMGLCSISARVGGILAPFVGLIQNSGAALPFLIFAIPAIMAAVLSMGLPETLGQPLPQTLADVLASRKRGKAKGQARRAGSSGGGYAHLEEEDGIQLADMAGAAAVQDDGSQHGPEEPAGLAGSPE